MTRLVTAAFLIPAAWYLCKRAPLGLFLAAAVLCAGLAAWECVGILKHRGARPFTVLAVGACVAIVFAFSLPSALAVCVGVMAGAALIAPTLAMARRASPEAMFDATMSTYFPVLFVGLPFAFVVGLRVIPGSDGPDLLLLALLCVTLSDTGAYYVGSAFGSHRMAPVISPKKSWEGVAGGVLGSVIAALIGHFWFFQRLPLAHALVLGVLLCFAGILGDLAESMLKRSAGVKDSSRLLPGHGGVLDRMDSLLVAAPVLYYYWGLFLAGAR
jgi:phosphatidate cytidylyltransferase